MRFRTAMAALVALATFGAATGIAVAESADVRSDAAVQLTALLSTGSEKADDKIVKALDALDDAAAEAAAGDLEKAVKEDADAVKELLKAIEKLDGDVEDVEEESDPAAVINAVVDSLVAADAASAAAAIADAEEAGADAKHLDKARDELAEADEASADGDLEKALEKYSKAIKEAAKAQAKGPSGSDGGNDGGEGDPADFDGKYSAYTFWFINLETGEETGPLTGTSHPSDPLGYTGKSNEGYLMVGGELMQLHVSCSDAFADGVGEKSDPAADSPWRVDRYSITKYSNGQADKSCDFVGLPNPSLTVAKTYRVAGGDWMDADAAAPGVVYTTQVLDFRFVVVNNGNIALDSASIVDDVFMVATAGNPDCATGTLAAGATLECMVSGVSLPAGDHVNVATATGSVDGMTVTVTDSAHLSVISGPPQA